VTHGVPSRRFYATAFGVGAAFANMGVAVPLQVAALGGRPTLAGALLAAGTVAIAFGALVAGAVSPRIGGGPRTLALALAVCGTGSLVFSATTSVIGIAAGGVLVGTGIGLFWVSSQLVLGRRSGTPGSASAFAVHFATYTLGAVLGSSLTGGIAAVSDALGLAAATGIRLSSLAGVAVTSVALALWWPCAVRLEPAGDKAALRFAPSRHLAVQLPDLLLVSALAFLLPLAPTVLAHGYHLGPLVIGFVMSGVSGAKIAGTFTARALARSGGARRGIVFLLAGGGVVCVLLCLALDAPSFVAALLVTALLVAGAWPLVVDSAQARVPPESRHDLTVVWNAREYGVIAVATFLAGWLLATLGRPEPLFALAALLIVAAAACSAVMLRRPVWQPSV
jgi:MFS family permease